MNIVFDNNSKVFTPMSRVEGEAQWSNFEKRKGELKLFWYSSGIGTEDVGIADECEFDASGSGSQRFSFQLPDQPWSFSGKLISVQWAVEFIVDDDVKREEIIVSPYGEEVVLKDASE